MSKQQQQVGYLLKHAQSLLRVRMEQALAPHNLTVSHYSCLYQLSQEPRISAAALARRTFVTRQSMGSLLEQLVDKGLVARVDQSVGGRALPIVLTPLGETTLAIAQSVVDEVEEQMLSALKRDEREALARGLVACIEGLQ